MGATNYAGVVDIFFFGRGDKLCRSADGATNYAALFDAGATNNAGRQIMAPQHLISRAWILLWSSAVKSPGFTRVEEDGKYQSS